MRTFEPLTPRRDMHPKDADLWKRLNTYLQQTSKAWGSVSRNISTDQSQEPPISPPGVNDHGALAGLVPILNGDGTVADYNDDHTQYPLIFGRPAGQYIYGSRAGTAGSWTPFGTFNLYGTNAESVGKAYAGISFDANAPTGTGIFLIMATSFFDPSSRGTNGATAYHTTLTDTAGNTWTKLKEITAYAGTSSWKTVSVWYSLVSVALTAGTHTLGCTFTTFTGPDVEMNRIAIEAYSFTLGAGTAITVVDSTSAEQNSLGDPASLTLTAAGETLYIRGMAIQSDGALNPTFYSPSSGFTPFGATHTDSTTTGAGGDNGFAARGEFKVSTVGQTTSPALAASDTYDIASSYIAVQVVPGATGLLDLYSAPLALAAHIQLQGETINTNADFINFRAPAGTTTLAYVRGSDGAIAGSSFIGGSGTFKGLLDFTALATSDKTISFQNLTGTVALLSDITAGLAAYLKLDASNDPLTGTLDTQVLRPSADNTYDLGDTTHFYKDLYLSSDIILKADATLDIGTAAIGIKQLHYAHSTASGTGTLRADSRGLLWEDAALGDVFVGADNLLGSIGYYSQRTCKANSSVTDYTEDATNLYQGAWGSMATPSFPFIELNFSCGGGAVGKYTGNSADLTTYLRDGAVTIGTYNSILALGGGGLFIAGRLTTSPGLYLVCDEGNKRFVLRAMSGNMAAQQMTSIGFAGTNLAAVVPVTDATVDLGITATNRYKSCFLSGFLELSLLAAVTTEGDLWNDSTSKGPRFYGAGISQYIERMLFTATASATVANTTTETTLVGSGVGTATLPANFFVVGRTLSLKAYGYYGTQLTGAATLRIKVYLGATAILDTTALAPTANLANRYWELDVVITCRTTGATGTVFAQGRFTHDDALVNFDDWTMVTTATTTIDTTIALAVAPKSTWGAGVAAADTITCSNLTIEALN